MVVHQFLASICPGDAISDEAIAIQQCLRSHGVISEIYAEHIDPSLLQTVHHYTTYTGDAAHTVLYHLSIGSPVAEYIRYMPGKRMIIYHNITPSHYLEAHIPELARLVRRGRQELRMLAPGTHLAVGDSVFNESELRLAGYTHTGVLPIVLDMTRLTGKRNDVLYHQYRDDAKNFLFVGRLCPHKSQHDIIKAFALYTLEHPKSRLFLVGSDGGFTRYRAMLQHYIDTLGLSNVHITGPVSAGDLATYYQLADLFVTMSEHEGFLVPVVEAMHFNVPILGFAAGAVPDTVGSGGILCTQKDPAVFAELMHRLTSDAALRSTIINNQHTERKRFDRAVVEKTLMKYITSLH